MFCLIVTVSCTNRKVFVRRSCKNAEYYIAQDSRSSVFSTLLPNAVFVEKGKSDAYPEIHRDGKLRRNTIRVDRVRRGRELRVIRWETL